MVIAICGSDLADVWGDHSVGLSNACANTCIRYYTCILYSSQQWPRDSYICICECVYLYWDVHPQMLITCQPRWSSALFPLQTSIDRKDTMLIVVPANHVENHPVGSTTQPGHHLCHHHSISHGLMAALLAFPKKTRSSGYCTPGSGFCNRWPLKQAQNKPYLEILSHDHSLVN